MAGDEVVQLYLTHAGIPAAPLRSLGGFQRVNLGPRQSKTVSFTLSGRDLSIVDEAGQRKVVPGTVQVWIGGGQPLVHAGLLKPSGAQTQFVINGTSTLPD
jgi:beta-glucosidase